MAAWKNEPILIVDTETTGTDPTADRVVEVAAVLVQGGDVLIRQSWLVDPGCAIPEAATAIHGITTQRVREGGAPFGDDVAFRLASLLAGAIPCAFNARFDRAMLIAEYLRAGMTPPPEMRSGVHWIDPLTWSRVRDQYAKGGHKLERVAERLGVERSESHRALGDCETTARVLAALMPGMPDDFDEMIATQRIAAAENEARYLRWVASQPKREVA